MTLIQAVIRIAVSMARLEGFEPTTPGSEDQCSIR